MHMKATQIPRKCVRVKRKSRRHGSSLAGTSAVRKHPPLCELLHPSLSPQQSPRAGDCVQGLTASTSTSESSAGNKHPNNTNPLPPHPDVPLTVTQ